MEKILISSCLLREKVRYNGSDLPQDSPLLDLWEEQGRLVPFCPEVEAGLPIPRPCVEIISGTGNLEDTDGNDYTEAFHRGARLTLALCRRHNIRMAVLNENSPSCGSSMIYDGSFTGNRGPGQGVTAALLASEGIRVFSQHRLDEAELFLRNRPGHSIHRT